MASKLNWSNGRNGKGNVYDDGDVSTWPVDTHGNPHHQEMATQDGETRPVFLFYITPNGGVNDGDIGFSNASGRADDQVIKELLNLDPRMSDGRKDDGMDMDILPRYETPTGFGHGYALLDKFTHWVEATEGLEEVEQPHFDPLEELQSWLDGFSAPSSAVAPSLHHDTAQDFIPRVTPTQAQTPHVDPPDHPYEPYDWAAQKGSSVPDPLHRASALDSHLSALYGEPE
jgi:hypothetical protein